MVVDFATGGVDVEVGSQGATVGSDVQMCDPDGDQKGLDKCFGHCVSIFRQGFGSSK
jgi:hypothetical protein